MGAGERIDVVQPHRHSARARHLHQRRPRRRHRRGRGGHRRPRPAGRRPRSTSAPRCSCAPPTCWPDRGGRSSPRRRCSASPRPRTRPRSTRRASSSTSGGSTSRSRAQILAEQPISARGVWNRTDYRPLEGFVYAITPVQLHRHRRQPAHRARADGQHRGVEAVAHADVRGVPDHAAARGGRPAAGRDQPGRPATGIAVSDVVLADPRLAGIHFTGSTATFQHLWREVGTNIDRYHTYPRLVGETGGKDFVVAHPSARPDVLRTALIRGAFDYQGQKCSAASRAFVAALGVAADGRRLPRRHRGAALRRRHRPDQLRRRADRRPVLRQERHGHRTGQERGRRHRRRRRRIRRQRRLFRPADRAAVRRSDRRGVLAPSTSARSWPCTSTPTTDYEHILDVVDGGSTYALTGAVIADDRAAVLTGRSSGCATRRATSTSTTSRPAPWSASSRSAGRGPRAPTTRPVRR